jgi:hypothetical protein
MLQHIHWISINTTFYTNTKALHCIRSNIWQSTLELGCCFLYGLHKFTSCWPYMHQPIDTNLKYVYRLYNTVQNYTSDIMNRVHNHADRFVAYLHNFHIHNHCHSEAWLRSIKIASLKSIQYSFLKTHCKNTCKNKWTKLYGNILDTVETEYLSKMKFLAWHGLFWWWGLLLFFKFVFVGVVGHWWNDN